MKATIAAAIFVASIGFGSLPASATCDQLIVTPSGNVQVVFEPACAASTTVVVSPGSSQANGVVADDGQHLTGTPGGLNGADGSNGLMATAVSLFGF